MIATDEPKVVRRDKTTWCNSKGRTVLERQHDGNYHVPVIGYLTISELRDLHEAISGALALHEHISKADEAANEGA